MTLRKQLSDLLHRFQSNKTRVAKKACDTVVMLTLLMLPALLAGAAVAAEAKAEKFQAGVPLVVKGRAQAIVVLPAAPSRVAKYAAEELVYHVAKATGLKLVVVTEGQETNEPEARVYLGPTKAAAQAGGMLLQNIWQRSRTMPPREQSLAIGADG